MSKHHACLHYRQKRKLSRQSFLRVRSPNADGIGGVFSSEVQYSKESQDEGTARCADGLEGCAWAA